MGGGALSRSLAPAHRWSVRGVTMSCCMAVNQLIKEARKPLIRTVATKQMPDLPLQEGHRWHLFLSHIWGTGQDQCATIKRQLKLLLPDVSIFLDVDVCRLTARIPD